METQEERALQNRIDELEGKLIYERQAREIYTARLEGELKGLRAALRFTINAIEPKEHNHE